MPRTSIQKKLLAAVLAPVIFLGLLEIALRLAGYSYDPVAEGSIPTPHGASQEIEFYRPDANLLWTLQPNSLLNDEERGFIEVRTNSAGLRGAALPGAKESGELRVLCLGDSITFGLALTEEEAFTTHLERRLASGPLGRGRQVRVISGAVPGWSSLQGLRFLDQYRDLDPDLVVFWFGMNDAQPARVLPDARLDAPNHEVIRTTTVLRSLRSFQLVQNLLHSVLGGVEESLRVSPEEFGDIVRELSRRAEDGGPVVLFIRCPTTLNLAIDQLQRVIPRAEEEGVDMVYGSRALLSAIISASPDTDLVGQRLVVNGKESLVFSPEHVELGAEVERLKSDLKALDKMRRALQASLATLPPDSVDATELFGTVPCHEFFLDNCHLSALGARLAGESLARIIEERLRSPSAPAGK